MVIRRAWLDSRIIYLSKGEYRLQNSQTVQVRVSSQTKCLERGWKQRARVGRDAKDSSPRFTDFFTDFEKNTDCFAVQRG